MLDWKFCFQRFIIIMIFIFLFCLARPHFICRMNATSFQSPWIAHCAQEEQCRETVCYVQPISSTFAPVSLDNTMRPAGWTRGILILYLILIKGGSFRIDPNTDDMIDHELFQLAVSISLVFWRACSRRRFFYFFYKRVSSCLSLVKGKHLQF